MVEPRELASIRQFPDPAPGTPVLRSCPNGDWAHIPMPFRPARATMAPGTRPQDRGCMAVTALVKSASEFKVTPNLLDYDPSLAPGFWERARGELDGLPGNGGLNIAYEAVDRHAVGARADHLTLRCLG